MVGGEVVVRSLDPTSCLPFRSWNISLTLSLSWNQTHLLLPSSQFEQHLLLIEPSAGSSFAWHKDQLSEKRSFCIDWHHCCVDYKQTSNPNFNWWLSFFQWFSASEMRPIHKHKAMQRKMFAHLILVYSSFLIFWAVLKKVPGARWKVRTASQQVRKAKRKLRKLNIGKPFSNIASCENLHVFKSYMTLKWGQTE